MGEKLLSDGDRRGEDRLGGELDADEEVCFLLVLRVGLAVGEEGANVSVKNAAAPTSAVAGDSYISSS